MANIDALLEAADLIEEDNADSVARDTGTTVECDPLHRYAKRHRQIRPKDDNLIQSETENRSQPRTRRKNTTSKSSKGHRLENQAQTIMKNMCLSSSDEDDIDFRKVPRRSGNRAVHNELEKNRRAHMKDCFLNLKNLVPGVETRRLSNLSILRCGTKYIEVLKNKETELIGRKAQLNHVRVKRELKVQVLKEGLRKINPNIDFERLEDVASQGLSDEETKSDTTDTADESPIVSEDDNVKKDFEGLMFKRQVLPRHSSPRTENKPIVTTQTEAQETVGSRLRGIRTIAEELARAEANKAQQIAKAKATGTQPGQVHVTTLNQLPANIRNQINMQIQQQKLQKQKQHTPTTLLIKQNAGETSSIKITNPAAEGSTSSTISSNKIKNNESLLKTLATNLAAMSRAKDQSEPPKQKPVQVTQSPQIITTQQLASILPGGSTVQLKPVSQQSAVYPNVATVVQQSQTPTIPMMLQAAQNNSFVLVPTQPTVGNSASQQKNAVKPDVARLLQQTLMRQVLQQQDSTKTSGAPVQSPQKSSPAKNVLLKLAIPPNELKAEPSVSSNQTSHTSTASTELTNSLRIGCSTVATSGVGNTIFISGANPTNQQNVLEKQIRIEPASAPMLKSGTVQSLIRAASMSQNSGVTQTLALTTPSNGSQPVLTPTDHQTVIMPQMAIKPMKKPHPGPILVPVSAAGGMVLAPLPDVTKSSTAVYAPQVSSQPQFIPVSANGRTILQPVSAGTTFVPLNNNKVPVQIGATVVQPLSVGSGALLQTPPTPNTPILQPGQSVIMQPVTPAPQQPKAIDGLAAVDINGVKHLVNINHLLAAAGTQTVNLNALQSAVKGASTLINQQKTTPPNAIQIAVPVNGNPAPAQSNVPVVALKSVSDMSVLQQAQQIIQKQQQQTKQLNLQEFLKNAVVLAPQGNVVQNVTSST